MLSGRRKMTLRSASAAALALLPISLAAQFLDPSVLKKPNAIDAWPTYHGDYSGKRYSTLDQINRSNVGTLTLAWAFKALATAETATNVGGLGKPGDRTYWGGPTDTYRIAADGGRHHVHFRDGPCLGHQRAHRRAKMELLFQNPRRPSQQRKPRHG